MFATRWRPFVDLRSEMNHLQNEVNRVFGGLGLTSRSRFPAINLREEDEVFEAELELPGLEFEDIEVYVTGGKELTVKGDRNEPVEDGNWHRQERAFGSFSRTVELPTDVDADKVAASFKNGVLRISLPKHEAVKPRRINVTS